MGHTAQVDRLLIRTAAGQAGIGNNGGQITAQCTRQRRGKSAKGSHRYHRHQPSPITATGCSDTHNPQTTPNIPAARVLDRRLSVRSRTEDAEFVALGIGQHDPALVALPDIGVRGAEG
jgi:hypothetical protein